MPTCPRCGWRSSPLGCAWPSTCGPWWPPWCWGTESSAKLMEPALLWEIKRAHWLRPWCKMEKIHWLFTSFCCVNQMTCFVLTRFLNSLSCIFFSQKNPQIVNDTPLFSTSNWFFFFIKLVLSDISNLKLRVIYV